MTRRGKYTEFPRSRRLGVERIAGAHVVADVGDRHHEPEAFSRLFAVHGVVEVFRRLSVDGDEGERPQILPAGKIALLRFLREARSERLRPRGESERQGVLPERDLDLDSGVGGVTQDLDDATDRRIVPVGLRRQLGDHDLPRSGAPCVLQSDEDILADAPLGRLNEQDPLLLV